MMDVLSWSERDLLDAGQRSIIERNWWFSCIAYRHWVSCLSWLSFTRGRGKRRHRCVAPVTSVSTFLIYSSLDLDFDLVQPETWLASTRAALTSETSCQQESEIDLHADSLS